MKREKKFEEKFRLFLAGNVDLYANGVVQDCIPHGEYVEVLGVGGEKAVLLYKDPILNQRRVLNVRLPDLSIDSEKRFLRGARILSHITESELLQNRIPPFPIVFDVREYPAFYICEYVRGVDLRDYINKRGHELTIREKLLLFKDLAEGLHLLHGYGIVHRDMKPDNVLILESGRTRIIDFGISITVYENSLTRSDIALGTPGYAAPEQMLDAASVDHRADIYSLAKVMYFIAVGDEEFAPEKLPTELLLVLPRAWQEDKERRYVSVNDFLLDVMAAYSDLNLDGESFSLPEDVSVGKAFADLLVLFGGNIAKVKKILGVDSKEWDVLMNMARQRIVI